MGEKREARARQSVDEFGVGSHWSPWIRQVSVLDALSTLLEIDGVPFGAIESEELARGLPWLATSEWLRQLAAVIGLQRDAGRELLLVVATTETQGALEGVIDAISADDLVVVCLSSSPNVVAERIANREPDAWPGKGALIAHARELAESVPAIAGIDVVLDTDGRLAADVAADVRDVLGKRGMLTTRDRHTLG